MTQLKAYLAVLVLAVLSAFVFAENGLSKSVSSQSESAETVKATRLSSLVSELKRTRVCQELKTYPKNSSDKLSFEVGEINALCKPFVDGPRESLDRCGDSADRFSRDGHVSSYTWPSHDEMKRKGRANLFTEKSLAGELEKLNVRIEEIRSQTTELCCGDDASCRAGMAGVEVSVCRPPGDSSISDPCVHGGAFEMAGRNYTSIFAAMQSRYTRDEDSEFRKITTKNLPIHMRGPTAAGGQLNAPLGGKIVLTSYVKKDSGIAALEPTLYHEFGHACTMVKMQVQAAQGQDAIRRSRALTALRWFDQVKNRCQRDNDGQAAAYADFWESVGESRELAQCFSKITELNRLEKIDKPCVGLCPGHYMEETVGVAFSLLTGDLTGRAESVFPNTCDHMRDSQHPMVADVMECLAQHSPRFRRRLADAYGCEMPKSTLMSGLGRLSDRPQL